MVEQKRFGGIMNLDDREDFILPNQHIHALNGRFYGGASGFTFENINGNTEISFSLPTGDNQCIGSFYDGLRQRIFWMNWNSNARNGLYMYDINVGTVTALLVSFTNSAADIFEFDLDYPIASQNIIYTTEADGDIWTWTDRNDRPKELNIKDAIDNIYGSAWLAEYLDVAKAPPSIPIACAYEDDATVTVNNLKGNKLFRFKYRFVYGTFQKSTWSSISEMPIPFDYTTQANDTDPTKNCRIGLIFQTGTPDVEKIEIAAQSIGEGDTSSVVVWGDFFSVKILDKSELSISDDTTYIWNFYNNESYNYVDKRESELLFDYVPNKANTQELLNGNVIVYGGITEGYDPIVPDVSVAVNQQLISMPNSNLGILCSQNGNNGIGTGNIRVSLVGNPNYATLTGNNSNVRVLVYNGATIDTLQAAPTSSSDTVADLLNTLSANAVIAGYTIVSNDGHTLVFNRANNLQVLNSYYIEGNGDVAKPVNLSVPATDLSSSESLGLVYFDEKYKSNGVTTGEDFNYNIFPISFTGTSGEQFYLPYLTLTINHRPPDWARYYQVVRTTNLTKSNYLSIVTDRTFKDDKFAYISIETINIYKLQNTTSVLSFDFLQGDRIKFVCLFNNDKTINTSYGNTHDYEIVGQVVNPNINGLVCPGQFVKVKLPTTSGTFDFGTFINNSYYYYYVELYTPAKPVSDGLNVYYEFSEMFQIGNPYTATRYHQGNTNNQASNLATPATSNFRKGDAYYRLREIRAGAFFLANTVPEKTYSWTNEPVLEQTVDTVPTGTSYTVKNTTAGNTTNANNWLIKTGTTSVIFNIKGKMIFKALATSSSTLLLNYQIKTTSGGFVGSGSLGTFTGGVISGQIFEINVNVDVTVAASRTFVLYLSETPTSSPAFSADTISGQLTFIDKEHDFTIGVVDPNFSDFFESKVNSNGRPSVVNADERELFFPTLLRWGLSYQQNTNINQINRFFPANFDEIDRSKGDIQRFKTRDRLLRVFQNRACGQYGVYAKFIQDNAGTDQLVTTDEILTKNNINYYAGEYGLGDQYTGLVSSKNADYFSDPVRGYDCRLSNDGITAVSQLYKGQFYIRDLITPYNDTYTRSDGSKAKILGCYDYFNEEWVKVLQGGTNSGGSISNHAFSFNEMRNAYSSFFSYDQAEWLQSAEDVIYTWKDGRLWVHDNTTNYCNFYGTQYDCSITLVFNMNLREKKTPESLTELASAIWSCPLIYSNVKSYGTQRQETALGDYDFAALEGEFEAAILRDTHSIGGVNNGDFMKSNWLCVKFLKSSASGVIWLTEATLMFKDSPLTNK